MIAAYEMWGEVVLCCVGTCMTIDHGYSMAVRLRCSVCTCVSHPGGGLAQAQPN